MTRMDGLTSEAHDTIEALIAPEEPAPGSLASEKRLTERTSVRSAYARHHRAVISPAEDAWFGTPGSTPSRPAG